MSDSAVEETKMPLLDHLIEMRKRVLLSVIAWVVMFVVCFYFANEIFNFLLAPLADVWADRPGKGLIFTALHEKFITNMKVAAFAAFFVTLPILSTQMWIFAAPGLYKNERGAFLPFLIFTPILFGCGAAFLYYVLMPVAWPFFAGFEQVAGEGELTIEMVPRVSEYLSFVMKLILAFGLSFELPVIISLLVRVRLATAKGLRARRRYAIVLAFVAAAILTPPDLFSQFFLAVPIILLFEISILCAVSIERSRRRREEAEEEDN